MLVTGLISEDVKRFLEEERVGSQMFPLSEVTAPVWVKQSRTLAPVQTYATPVLQAPRPLSRPPSGTRSSIGHARTPPPIAAPVAPEGLMPTIAAGMVSQAKGQ